MRDKAGEGSGGTYAPPELHHLTRQPSGVLLVHGTMLGRSPFSGVSRIETYALPRHSPKDCITPYPGRAT